MKPARINLKRDLLQHVRTVHLEPACASDTSRVSDLSLICQLSQLRLLKMRYGLGYTEKRKDHTELPIRHPSIARPVSWSPVALIIDLYRLPPLISWQSRFDRPTTREPISLDFRGYASIKRLVLRVEQLDGDLYFESWFTMQLPKSLHEIVIILWPPDPSSAPVFTPCDIGHVFAMIFADFPGSLTICGQSVPECQSSEDATSLQFEQLEEGFREKLVQTWPSINKGEEKLAERLEKLRFMSIRDYIKSESWEGEFAPEEEKIWS